jgi:hypothetical protein
MAKWTFLVFLALCASALSLPQFPLVSEVDVPMESGPVIIVLEQAAQDGVVLQEVHDESDSSAQTSDEPEDFVQQPVQVASDVPNPEEATLGEYNFQIKNFKPVFMKT